MPRRIKIWGDLHLFDPLGRAREADTATIAECTGTACIANTAAPKGALPAHRLKLYGSTQLQGVFKTLKHSMALLELHDIAGAGHGNPRGYQIFNNITYLSCFIALAESTHVQKKFSHSACVA